MMTIDSRGGVQPLLALAVALRHHGHTVTMVQPSDLIGMVESHGVASHALSMNVRDFLAARQGTSQSRWEEIAEARRTLPGMLETWMREAAEALSGVDVIVAGTTGLMVARSVAAALDVPLVEAHLQPIGPPTGQFPGIRFAPPPWTGAVGNVASHVLTNASLTVPLRVPERRAAEKAFGAGARPAKATQALYGYSPLVVPRPRSWRDDRHVVGYWTLADPTATLTPALEEFLAAGDAPVCVGFGSMAISDPTALARRIVDAVRSLGRRTVLLSGWGGLALDIAAPDVITVAEAPHHLLFPRTLAVVHHGGAGTTGATLTAGVPSVVVPWGADQPFWADRLAALRVAPPPLTREHLGAGSLTHALGEATTDETRDRAAQIAHELAKEDGCARAVAVIESTVREATP